MSCSLSVFRRPEHINMSTKAVFAYLEQPNPYLEMMEGKGQIKLDPDLRIRDSLFISGKLYFKDQMRSDLLLQPSSTKHYQLIIPDNFAVKYAYVEGIFDYEHDYALIHQFSPLLPTKEPDIYFMEHYFWSNSCSVLDNRCIRMLIRQFIKFKIVNQEVECLGTVSLLNQLDFIGFGGFSRNKMIEALPGAQIKRFGW